MIDTGIHRPFKQSLRRHPLAHLEIIDKHVSKILQNDIIEPAASPWASNVVLVRKANEQLRFAWTIVSSTYQGFIPPSRRSKPVLIHWEDRSSSAALISGRDTGRLRSTRRRPIRQLLLQGNELSGSWRWFDQRAGAVPEADGSSSRRTDLGSLPGVSGRRHSCGGHVRGMSAITWHIERLKLVMDRLQRAGLKLNPAKCKLF